MRESINENQKSNSREHENHIQNGLSSSGLSFTPPALNIKPFIDKRPQSAIQRKRQEMMDQSPQVQKGKQLQAKIDKSPRMISERERLSHFFGGEGKKVVDVGKEITRDQGILNFLENGKENHLAQKPWQNVLQKQKMVENNNITDGNVLKGNRDIGKENINSKDKSLSKSKVEIECIFKFAEKILEKKAIHMGSDIGISNNGNHPPLKYNDFKSSQELKFKTPKGEPISIGEDSFNILVKDGILWEYSFKINNEIIRVNYRADNNGYVPITTTTKPGSNSFPGSYMGTLNYAGPLNPKNAQGEYDYSLRPLSLIDYYGMKHDQGYDQVDGAIGPAGVEMLETLPFDIALVKGAEEVIKLYNENQIAALDKNNLDPFTGERISYATYQNALLIKAYFGMIVKQKMERAKKNNK